MKSIKKGIAMLLAVVMLMGVFAVPVFAAVQSDFSLAERAEHLFYKLVDKLILILGKFLNSIIPGINWTGKIPDISSYVTENFYSGKDKFDYEIKDGAVWSMGFSSRSFLDNIDLTGGEYYLAGKISFAEPIVAKGVLDDQGVSVYALSDGETTVVYAAVDGYSLARGDVLEIRSRLADFADENNISSINVSALHQHSCIDTLGLGAALLPVILRNPLSSLFYEKGMVSGVNKSFMEEIYSAVTASVIEAVNSMKEGSLYFGNADISEYIKDKREPAVFDPNFERIRFVPYDESANEIWVCETGLHPTSVSSANGYVTSDFPYYIKQYVKEICGADVVFIQGAELALTRNTSSLSFDPAASLTAEPAALGEALGKKLIAIENDEPLAPVLNVSHRELEVIAENPVHIIAGREGLLSTVMVKDGIDFAVITEIGYMELGNSLGILLVPGEIDPAIIWGGAVDPNKSWTGKSWEYAPLADTIETKNVICFGLCNDQIGYILCDNDYRSMLTENEEINALTPYAGSVLTQAFEKFISEVK
ncbi:MAG: hypothetical protein J1E34_08160 [Oscillospiraceae bacterium]|nr:hypothetical protein [Oscillospiraceae bacterium]